MLKRNLPVPATVARALDTALDRALSIQRPLVRAYLGRLRARRPDAAPAAVIEQLERHYRNAVTGIGAAAGGSAAVPGAGTAAAVATSTAEISAFVSATAMYVLALAEVHGVPVADAQVRRALVLTVLLGEGGPIAIESLGARAGPWADALGRSASKEKVAGINARLTHLMLTRFGARQSVLLVGRALPMGIGAGVGAVGNVALARAAIGAARRVFGPAPARFGPPAVESAGPHPRRDRGGRAG